MRTFDQPTYMNQSIQCEGMTRSKIKNPNTTKLNSVMLSLSFCSLTAKNNCKILLSLKRQTKGSFTLIAVRKVMYHLGMKLLATISVNRLELCQTREVGALLSPLSESYSDYENYGHKTTFNIIKDFISFEAGVCRRLRQLFLPSQQNPLGSRCCRKSLRNSELKIATFQQMRC